MLKKHFNKFKTMSSHEKFFLIVFILFFLVILFYLYNSFFSVKSLNVASLSQESLIQQNKSSIYYSLYKSKGYLYKSDKEGLDAAMDFINKNPSFQGNKKLLPEGFEKSTTLVRVVDDKSDAFLKDRQINLTNEHYYFDQKIQGIPVYGAQLAVHLKNKNEIYSLSGNLVTSQLAGAQGINEDQARKIALDTGYKEATAEPRLKINKTKKYVFNKKILGLEEDNKNYVALEVEVNSDNILVTFSKSYFVDLANGEIIYSSPRIYEALDRKIYNCSGGCQMVRGEGAAAIGDSDVDSVYDYFGDIYNYYSSSFQRDSFDGAGASYKAYVHASQQLSCPNAAWTGTEMMFCNNMVTKDITAHELTHAVTNYTANLEYVSQSGALNESVSDIFGSIINDGKWTMGEGSALGIIRYLDDPPKKGQPDKLFSGVYYCAGPPCTRANDNCGVHKNSGVMNKAFYLMTQGGDFNGCSINGVGSDKSGPIAYYTLTRRLNNGSNFREMYNAMIASCDELYQADSSICQNVKAALQATEMDQQPANQQQGASCGGAQPTAPVCAGGTAPTNPPVTITPTVTRAPTSNPSVTAAVTPTSKPVSYSISGSVYEESGSGQKTYKSNMDVSLAGSATNARKTDAQGKYSFTNLVSGTYVVSIKRNGQTVPSGNIVLTKEVPSQIVDFALYPNGESQTKVTPIPAPTDSAPTSGVSPTGTSSITSSLPDDGNGDTDPQVTKAPYKCVPDPECKTDGDNIRWCSLKCTPL